MTNNILHIFHHSREKLWHLPTQQQSHLLVMMECSLASPRPNLIKLIFPLDEAAKKKNCVLWICGRGDDWGEDSSGSAHKKRSNICNLSKKSRTSDSWRSRRVCCVCQPGADFISSFTVKVTMCLQQQPDEQQANVVRKVVCCFFCVPLRKLKH